MKKNYEQGSAQDLYLKLNAIYSNTNDLNKEIKDAIYTTIIGYNQVLKESKPNTNNLEISIDLKNLKNEVLNRLTAQKTKLDKFNRSNPQKIENMPFNLLSIQNSLKKEINILTELLDEI